MKNFRTLNNIFGWLAFIIAAITYLATMESTASLWDCSEFIVSGYKLEVGHPPGAPLFMIMMRFFTLFATSPQTVAFMANSLSAIMSALTILFLFWSISHLARKLIGKNIDDLNLGDKIAVFGSAMVGALAYTFSDTFWFSAVEAEVYATSSVITAVVFWAILKWEECADEVYANRWLILIAYITGLSVGVHLLNLLAVPAIVFVFYFRKFKVTKWNTVKASIISVVILSLLIWGIIPGVPKMASWFELPFVNGLGLPINSGVIFYILLLTAALSYAIIYTYKKRKLITNTIVLCLTVFIVGYSSYAMVIIRSSANLPMDQNSPDNIFALISFLNRDQYGDRPLVFGQYYNAPAIASNDSESYVRVGNRYEKAEWKQKNVYDPRYTTFLPRMHNAAGDKVNVYKSYVKGKRVPGGTGEQAIVPTFGENLTFLFDYQINFMYWRYFLWNFAGRQNDMQATKGDVTKGNWLSGIKFLDEARLGTQDNLPNYLQENKGKNKYYMFPLLLGLLGLVYQFLRNKRNFVVVTLLFFFTGIAVVLYLNQSPIEPRERDYAYAGSFYAFAIWIGLGVLALYKALSRYTPSLAASGVSVAITMLAVPVVMLEQNWDDHNRHGSYVAADFGYNYLNSVDEEGLVFVFGDNDTFPLWYNQEVEEERTDVRVANLMYLSADWYYKQLMRRTYTSAPFKTTATLEKIAGSRRSFVPFFERTKNAVNINTELENVMSDEDSKKVQINLRGGEKVNYFRSSRLVKPIDRADVIRKGLVPEKDTAYISPQLVLTVDKTIYKNSLAVLDLVANNFTERPLYFGVTTPPEYQMGLGNNLIQEGLAQKLVPYNTQHLGGIDVDKSYDLVMNKFRFRALNNNVYLGETARRMTVYYRNLFFTIGNSLEANNRKEELAKLTDKFDESLPQMVHPFAYYTNPLMRLYLGAGQTEKAAKLTDKLCEEYLAEIAYFMSLTQKKRINYNDDISMAYTGLNNLRDILNYYNQSELSAKVTAIINTINN